MSASSPSECRLVTIPISHFCEKARWALDRAGIPFRESAHLQVAHIVAARLARGGRTVPVLVTPGGVLRDSSDILAYADAHAPAERRLYPGDPVARTEVRALEDGWDERLGPAGRLWMYHSLRGRRDVVMAYGATGVPTWERRALPLAYPLMSVIIDRYLGVNDDTAASSLSEVRATFDDIADRLADGRPYLVGDAFTAADLTFAALAAPIVLPSEYGVPLPRPDELPPPMAAVVRELREHPAGAFALRMFREER
jgi:glutathione S-transferase